MKARLLALRARLDALAVRERVMVFAASAAIIVFVLYAMVLGPQLKRQVLLKAQIAQHRNNIAGIDAEITARVQAYAIDPDEADRRILAKLTADINALGTSLRAMQNGLLQPEQVAPMLETMLKANGRLQLVSLKSLPVTVMNGTAPGAAGADAPREKQNPQPGLSKPMVAAVHATPLDLLYRHGVEITVRGNYLDMVNYLTTLEAMPARLFWGQAELRVDTYPDSRLTLTVYTLSLEQKWMKL